MKKGFLLFIAAFTGFSVFSQNAPTPDIVYGELFRDVQMAKIFPDQKTFADCIPKKNPQKIVSEYLAIKKNPAIRFSLKMFVEENFSIPVYQYPVVGKERDIQQHVRQLWKSLEKNDKTISGSSLIPLPYSYIAPGGQFDEFHYMDSYFIMLGLKESGQYDMIESMMNNFSYMTYEYGYIPQGNRTYYMNRSQLPFFALMLDLYAEIKGNYVYATFLPTLQKEYDFWMDKSEPTKHMVKMPDGSFLNRYYVSKTTPRPDAYATDVAIGNGNKQRKPTIYRNLRAADVSGWNLGSRWLSKENDPSTIQTDIIVPVDLNCLLYKLELAIARGNRESGNLMKERYYKQLAERRKASINKYFWSSVNDWYLDYNIYIGRQSPELTMAGMMPFFLNIAPESRIKEAAAVLEKKFLKAGGVATSLKNSGLVWDAPNGIAPLQWICINGLDNYGEKAMAKEVAGRWVKLNVKHFQTSGMLFDKYNVEDVGKEVKETAALNNGGIGWTAGVLQALIKKFDFRF